MRSVRRSAGFTVIELMFVLAILSVLLVIAFIQWTEYTQLQRVRYGTVQLATDIREAMERAKAERIQYTLSLTASSPNYTIIRVGGGFTENAELPSGVTATATTVFYVSAFGKPVDAGGTPANYNLAVQNPKGTGTIDVTSAGGVTYQQP